MNNELHSETKLNKWHLLSGACGGLIVFLLVLVAFLVFDYRPMFVLDYQTVFLGNNTAEFNFSEIQEWKKGFILEELRKEGFILSPAEYHDRIVSLFTILLTFFSILLVIASIVVYHYHKMETIKIFEEYVNSKKFLDKLSSEMADQYVLAEQFFEFKDQISAVIRNKNNGD